MWATMCLVAQYSCFCTCHRVHDVLHNVNLYRNNMCFELSARNSNGQMLSLTHCRTEGFQLWPHIVVSIIMCIMCCRKMSESRMEYRLKNTPGDCIQSVKFGPSSSQFLLVASWDKSVRLFDVVNNNMRLQYQHSGPVLDCCFQVRYIN